MKNILSSCKAKVSTCVALGGAYSLAFTLSEVLITLGIIGVVAAITMPALVSYYKAQVMRTQFKKAYSIITNATRLLVNEDISPYDEFGVGGSANDPLNYGVEQYLRVIDGKLCLYSKDKICQYNKSLKNLTGEKNASLPIYTTRYIMTKDNIAVFLGSYSPHYIIVDINGPKKGPNRLGHDIQSFKITQDNNIKPMLYTDHDGRRCSMTVKSDGYWGAGCTEFALMDKNPDGAGNYWYDFLKTTK